MHKPTLLMESDSPGLRLSYLMARNFTNDDERFMARALALAARGQGYVEPNPMVGCVIVRGGRIVGEGYHRRFGGPHAEVHALQAAGPRAKGATVYVTLEPCAHHGKTPPCVDALVAAGVKRVFAAMRDPFGKVCGRGFRRLRAAGIDVRVGLHERQARLLNAPYMMLHRAGRPWVILKWAQSLDGRIATQTGDSQWISSPQSRRRAHQLRGRVDAVVVGVNTVLADNPRLDCRMAKPKRIASRVVLDPTLRTPLSAYLVRTAKQVPLLIVTSPSSVRTAKADILRLHGAELVPVRKRGHGLDLPRLLQELGRRGMTNIMIEGGGKTLGLFHDAGLADEVVAFICPRLIGGRGAPSPLNGCGPAKISESPIIGNWTAARSGPDYRFRLVLHEP
ncbi:MAG: bifunctional diaminohydroxyphosphoribosylaminopyrimidine deaminase/5-amino-6-(5-phosphoribosylamino)uracil reductase RibD [Phycisphaerales bacterium]|nr:bifunctional diaminohydroxyphosphoribosylaminopyrimidine deaminase/5-amino-6-(5-phosphoribosylamino)uracil reductase RibD [Phycisphaerales bacterium]